MGTQCGGYPPPDPNTTNHCNDYGSKYYMRDFCSLAGVGGKSNRIKWCGKLGTTDEWGVDDTNGTHDCTYDSCKEYRVLGTGCCEGCCGIVGKSVDCKRQQFKGDPLKCCLQDKVCTYSHANDDAPPECFSDTNKKYTCAPCHRDVTSSGSTKADGSKKTCDEAKVRNCKELILDYCSGADTNDDDVTWMDRWYNPVTGIETPQSCMYALKRNLYTGLGCHAADITMSSSTGTCSPYIASGDLSASGAIWGQDLMNAVFEKYKKNGYTIGSTPGTSGYNPFQEFLYQICCTAPILCQKPLDDSCSIYSAQRLSYNPQVANWCGCYLPQHEYDEYVNKNQINKECTPTCNRPGSIPSVTGDGDPYLCTQTVCLIDDISINLVSSDLSGDVSINQMCSNCNSTSSEGSTATCSCIIQDNTIIGVEAQIGGISINESCSTTQCSISNPDPDGSPPVLTVPCDQVTNPDEAFAEEQARQEESQAKITRQENITKIIIIILAIIAIWVAYLIINRKEKPKAPKIKGVPMASQTQDMSSMVGSRSIGSGLGATSLAMGGGSAVGSSTLSGGPGMSGGSLGGGSGPGQMSLSSSSYSGGTQPGTQRLGTQGRIRL